MPVTIVAGSLLLSFNLSILDCKSISKLAPAERKGTFNLSILDCKSVNRKMLQFYEQAFNLSILDCKSASA